MSQLWKIAFRDLLRNKRRSLLTMLAMVMGVTLLIFMSAIYKGIMDGSLKMAIMLQSSHLQLRAESYDLDQVSMEWKDLLSDPNGLTQQIRSSPGVMDAMAVIWANGMVLSGEESVGVTINGVDVQSSLLDPIRESVVAGEMPGPDDRAGVLVGKRLAQTLDLKLGDEIVLVISTSNQSTDQAPFTIRGLYDTGVGQYDEVNVYMPLAKAQTFSAAGDRASAIRVLLDNRDNSDAFAAAFAAPGLKVLTWRDLNALILTSMDATVVFTNMLNVIVLGMVAVVIANTLLMSVFERIREMGILAALGMKGRQILTMFLMEAGMLGMAGVAAGMAVGGAIVYYYSKVGLEFPQSIMEAKASNMITYGRYLYLAFSPENALTLALTALVIILVVAIYPAWFAARLEPVQALHGK
jgi:ABC-type lipoprotein release transport system permease subunit